jgi:adenine-specific DNA-methyltransferase
MIREWLDNNPIGLEDGLRHDKWLCMMWPRLKLLHELLAENGSLWITLDDNEVGNARCALDQIFGQDSFIGQIAWQKRTSRENRAVLSPSIDHLLVYSKCLKDTWRLHRNRLSQEGGNLGNPDNDPRGPWTSVPFSAQGFRANQVYEITTPTGKVLDPPKGRCWGATEPEFIRLRDVEKKVYWPKGGDGRPRIKQFPEDQKGLVPDTLWLADEVGDTEESKKLLLEIFSDVAVDFHAPKPVSFVERCIAIAAGEGALVLDSFAGSGTTAHAVLSANSRDGGNRRFIMVECEDYAHTLTAERVRRVIDGYAFKGTQRDELLREPLTFSKLKKANTLLENVQRIETLDGPKYDRIKSTVKDGALIVTGERDCLDSAPGLGGSFTYCTLGDAIDMDGLLTGQDLPPVESLAALLYHTATAKAFDTAALTPAPDIGEAVMRLGEASGRHLWLFYKPDLEWLKSADAALTLSRARAIAASALGDHLVFAPAKFVSRELLAQERLPVEYAPLPFALYRVETA